MISYFGTYDGRAGFSPWLGQAPVPMPAGGPVPTPPPSEPAAEAPKTEPAAPSAVPTVSIGGVRVSIWNILLAGAAIIGAATVISASVGAMGRR